MKTLAELEKDAERLAAKIKELREREQKSGKRWKPDAGEIYWTPSGDGAIDYCWRNDVSDKYMWAKGEVFKTKEEAAKRREFLIEKQAVLDELRVLNKGFVPDWGNEDQAKYTFIYVHNCKKWKSHFCTVVQGNSWPVFAEHQDAENAIKVLGDRLDVLLEE